MKRFLARAVGLLVILTGLLYAGDCLLLRYRISHTHSGLGSLTVRRYYAIQEKNNRTEFMFGDATAQTCVHSLFPHLGDPPCWYLARHTDQRIDM